jgi:hypothetical protein
MENRLEDRCWTGCVAARRGAQLHRGALKKADGLYLSINYLTI